MNAFRFKHNFIVKVIKWEVIYKPVEEIIAVNRQTIKVMLIN